MKIVIIALIIISVSSTIVSAKSGQNIPELVQEIWNKVFTNGEDIARIESKVDALDCSTDYSGQLTDIQSSIDELPDPVDYSAQLSTIQTSVDGIPYPIDYNEQLDMLQESLDALDIEDAINNHEQTIINALTAQMGNIDLRMNRLEDQISAIPVMESAEGKYSAVVDPGTHTIFNEFYSNPATVHLTMSVDLPEPGSMISVWTSVRDEVGGTTTSFQVGFVRSDSPSGLLHLEFTGRRCWIKAYSPNGGLIAVYYSVTATYLP